MYADNRSLMIFQKWYTRWLAMLRLAVKFFVGKPRPRASTSSAFLRPSWAEGWSYSLVAGSSSELCSPLTIVLWTIKHLHVSMTWHFVLFSCHGILFWNGFKQVWLRQQVTIWWLGYVEMVLLVWLRFCSSTPHLPTSRNFAVHRVWALTLRVLLPYTAILI